MLFPHIRPCISYTIEAITLNAGNTVVLYQIGSFIEISRGPMIANTSHMGKVSVVAVHPIETNQGQLFRVQGVALPKGFMVRVTYLLIYFKKAGSCLEYEYNVTSLCILEIGLYLNLKTTKGFCMINSSVFCLPEMLHYLL